MKPALPFLLASWWLTSQDLQAVGGVDKPPAAAPARETKFTSPKEAKLGNGLRILVAERPGLPLLTIQFVLRHGSEIDPPDCAGTASFVGSLLSKGTEKMSAPQIAEVIESLGGSIFSGCSWDSSMAGVVVTSDKAEPAITVLADIVRRPTFQAEEVERLRRQSLDRLRVALQQPGEVSGYAMTRIVYPEGEYAHPAGGTPETIAALRRDDILNLYRSYYRPESGALIFSGNIDLEQAKQLAEKYFGDWKVDSAPAPAASPSGVEARDWKVQSVVVDMPEAGQASVGIGKPAIKRKSPDYYTAMVANAALGSGFASRLNQEIRIKRGLSYGAGSSFSPRRDAGAFSGGAQTKNESAPEVASLLQAEVKRLATNPVVGEELKSRQAMLTGGFARGMETNQGVAGNLGSLIVYDLPLDTLDRYIPAINSITSTNISDFVTKYFTSPTSIVIVGRASAFLEPLKKAIPETRVISQSNLDLNRADLTKPSKASP